VVSACLARPTRALHSGNAQGGVALEGVERAGEPLDVDAERRREGRVPPASTAAKGPKVVSSSLAWTAPSR